MKKLTFLMMLLGLIFISAGDVMAIGDGYVKVCKDRHFGGFCWTLGTIDSRDVLGEGMSGNIESVEVGRGVKITLYDKEYQKGAKIVLYPGVYPSLNMNDDDNPWNNEAESLKTESYDNSPLIKLTYDNINHSGDYGGDGSNFTQMIGLGGTDEFKADYCLLLDNNVISAEIPKEYKVTFYQDSGYGGNHNSVPISGRTVNMADIGLGFKVSSIKIEWNKYKLTKVKMEKTSTTPKMADTYSTPMAGDVECDNRAATAGVMHCLKHLESSYSATATTSFENSTTIGLTSTTTVKASVGVEGVASGSVEESLALSVSDTVSFGSSDAKTHEQKVFDDVTIDVPAGSGLGFTLDVTPSEIEYDLTYIYSTVNSDENPDNSGPDKVVKGKMTVKSASTTKAVARNLPGSKSADLTQPAPDKGFGTKMYEYFASFPQAAADYFRWLAGYPTSNSNSNSNTNTSVVPSNTAANSNNQASNTAANTAKEEVPLTQEAKVFKNSLVGTWTNGNETVTFNETVAVFKWVNQYNPYNTSPYRIVDEKTVEFTSNGTANKATITFKDDGNTLVWFNQLAGQTYNYTRVKPN